MPSRSNAGIFDLESVPALGGGRAGAREAARAGEATHHGAGAVEHGHGEAAGGIGGGEEVGNRLIGYAHVFQARGEVGEVVGPAVGIVAVPVVPLKALHHYFLGVRRLISKAQQE